MNKAIWIAWWLGTLLIIGSWISIVPNVVGWVGFVIACVASLISVILNKYWAPPSSDRNNPQDDGQNKER